MIMNDIRFGRGRDGCVELEARLISGMHFRFREYDESCLIVDMENDDENQLRDPICYEGKSYRLESISDSPFWSVLMTLTEFNRHIREISGALWNCPTSIVFQKMNERDFEFSVVTTPKQIEKIDNSAF
jgi:hypothetical protein